MAAERLAAGAGDEPKADVLEALERGLRRTLELEVPHQRDPDRADIVAEHVRPEAVGRPREEDPAVGETTKW